MSAATFSVEPIVPALAPADASDVAPSPALPQPAGSPESSPEEADPVDVAPAAPGAIEAAVEADEPAPLELIEELAAEAAPAGPAVGAEELVGPAVDEVTETLWGEPTEPMEATPAPVAEPSPEPFAEVTAGLASEISESSPPQEAVAATSPAATNGAATNGEAADADDIGNAPESAFVEGAGFDEMPEALRRDIAADVMPDDTPHDADSLAAGPLGLAGSPDVAYNPRLLRKRKRKERLSSGLSAEASDLRRRGMAMLRQRHMPEAIDCFNRIVELQPQSAKAYRDLGAALLRDDRLEEAVSRATEGAEAAAEILRRLRQSRRRLPPARAARPGDLVLPAGDLAETVGRQGRTATCC